MKFDSLILCGLGSPQNADARACEIFLREFLSDKEILPAPFFVRKILASRIAKKRAQAYAQKLLDCKNNGVKSFDFYAQSLCKKVEENLKVESFYAATYGENTIEKALEKALKNGVNKNILFLPLFPQKSSATTFTPVKKFLRASKKFAGNFRIVEGYCGNPCYLSHIANSIGKLRAEKVILSFHSILISQLKKWDYKSECEKTLFNLQKILPNKKLTIAWQSSMKFGKWISPKIEDTATENINAGVKNLGVVCAGFFCECLETALEINRDLRNLYLARGGESFEYAPCLNDSDEQLEIINDIMQRQG